jgi:hypothetical protein
LIKKYRRATEICLPKTGEGRREVRKSADRGGLYYSERSSRWNVSALGLRAAGSIVDQ